MRKSVRRGAVAVTAFAGLWGLGAGAAQASEPAPAGGVSKVSHQWGGTLTRVAGAVHSATTPHSAPAPRAGRSEEAGKATHVTRHGRRVGKAVTHATEEAAKAVPPAAPHGSRPASRDAVSRVEAASPAASAPGLPKGLKVEIPQVVPGVPSIGIIPASLPELPITPTVPII